MRKNKISPSDIWKEYQKGVAYNDSIGLYEHVKQNEAFYFGDQWQGVNAPDLEKPVINFTHRVISYFISMLVSDDIGISLDPFFDDPKREEEAEQYKKAIERVLEKTKYRSHCRTLLKDSAVDGDGCFYFRWDPDAVTGQDAEGDIAVELVDNTALVFGNPTTPEVQHQPYIILSQRLYVGDVQDEAEEAGIDPETIKPDEDEKTITDAENYAEDLVTVLTKFYRDDNGRVHFVRVTKDVTLKKDTATEMQLYPFAWMPWEVQKRTYHGKSAVTEIIPNQIYVNKLWAMFMEHQKLSAFPKVVYDRTRMGAWTNRVGEAIGVTGDPTTAIASAFRAPDFSAQALELVERTINHTKECMGASDAALGNVNPDNTSAIIATQKATAAPLELQRRSYFQLVEDSVRVICDMIRSYYGLRIVGVEEQPQPVMLPNGMMSEGEPNRVPMLFDFAAVDIDALELNVEVGSAAYWSELTQMQTSENLFTKGIYNDAILYLESIPDSYIKNKQAIIDSIKDAQEQATAAQQMQSMPQGGGNPLDYAAINMQQAMQTAPERAL